MQLAAARIEREADRFDIIHSHLENFGFLLARNSRTPVVSTLHGRLDTSGLPELLAEFQDIPLVAISENQRRWAPENNWVATIHHGLPLEGMPYRLSPGDYLAVVGRISAEKGLVEAIELARRSGMSLRIAAKLHRPEEHAMFESDVRPAIDDGTAEFLGELQADQRDPLLAGAFATLMLGAWPEPFGLVAIESLATGTPVIARRAGALPEIIEPGLDGFIVDDLVEAELALTKIAKLDRRAIRERALERFSTERMVCDYEAVYAAIIDSRRRERRAMPMMVPLSAASPAVQALPVLTPTTAGNGARVNGDSRRRRSPARRQSLAPAADGSRERNGSAPISHENRW